MADLHPDLEALLGAVIHDRYRIDALLGQGGMGAVFRGRHLGLARDVAIKVLRPELGRSDSTAKRFDREAHSVSRLDHPNCVRVFDFGTTEGGVKYLVMELLEGAELKDSLGAPWPPAQAVDSVVQILEGLEHAHHVGVVHRDLKPENVFVTRDFRGRELIKLVDFGIAKLIDDEGAREQLTRAGMVFGTPRYMSPEQASGGKLDERTDLYAAGLILYEMLAGRPPFVTDEAAMLLRMHILAPPPELPAGVPPALAAVVMKLLEKSRHDRYASAREAIDALAQLRPGLAQIGAATGEPEPALTGPIATPSMATRIEAPTTASALHPSVAAPPIQPSLPAPPMQPPIPAAPVQPPATGWTPAPVNAPTAGGPAAYGPSQATTGYAPLVVAQPVAGRPARPWLPWAIAAGALMLALMAFGAGQALQDDEPPSGSNATSSAAPSTASSAATADPGGSQPAARYDRECTNRDECELDCGRGCSARCADANKCEVSVGPDSRVLCEGVEECEVRCQGDCRVDCPGSGCEVSCESGKPDKHDKKDDKKDDKKAKKRKPAKRCDGAYVCGDDCDDD